MYKYTVGDKIYIQKPLVLGQISQLIECLKGKTIEWSGPLEMYSQLKDRFPRLLAIVLTEEGKSPGGKDLDTIEVEVEFSIDLDTTLKVIEDFFDCNPTASLLKKLAGMSTKILRQMPTGSKKSPSPSQEETSPGETPSSGDTH